MERAAAGEEIRVSQARQALRPPARRVGERRILRASSLGAGICTDRIGGKLRMPDRAAPGNFGTPVGTVGEGLRGMRSRERVANRAGVTPTPGAHDRGRARRPRRDRDGDVGHPGGEVRRGRLHGQGPRGRDRQGQGLLDDLGQQVHGDEPRRPERLHGHPLDSRPVQHRHRRAPGDHQRQGGRLRGETGLGPDKYPSTSGSRTPARSRSRTSTCRGGAVGRIHAGGQRAGENRPHRGPGVDRPPVPALPLAHDHRAEPVRHRSHGRRSRNRAPSTTASTSTSTAFR